MLKVCYILYSSYKDYMHILMIYLSDSPRAKRMVP